MQGLKAGKGKTGWRPRLCQGQQLESSPAQFSSKTAAAACRWGLWLLQELWLEDSRTMPKTRARSAVARHLKRQLYLGSSPDAGTQAVCKDSSTLPPLSLNLLLAHAQGPKKTARTSDCCLSTRPVQAASRSNPATDAAACLGKASQQPEASTLAKGLLKGCPAPTLAPRPRQVDSPPAPAPHPPASSPCHRPSRIACAPALQGPLVKHSL